MFVKYQTKLFINEPVDVDRIVSVKQAIVVLYYIILYITCYINQCLKTSDQHS